MKIVDRFFNSFVSSVESLRLNKILLNNVKKEVVEKSKEHLAITKEFKKGKEYFLKSQMGKPILESMENKYKKQLKDFESFCETASKKQIQLKNQSYKIYKSNPSFCILQEFDDFVPEDKFNNILINLVKGHQDGLIDSKKLISLKEYKRVDLEKGSVFVKDNRTHYSDVIVINEKNEILFLVRNKMGDFQPNKYCFPGGHVDQGEDHRYAATRELVEETGIKVESEDLVECGTYTDNKVVIHYFTIKVKKEEVNIFLEEKEHESYEWIAMENIKNYPLILNLKENLESIISIPIEFFINNNVAPSNVLYINGMFLKEEDEQLVKSLNTIYTAYRIGDISEEQYEKHIKKSHREVQPFNLYKPNGETFYGVRISENIEKSNHKYYFREGSPGNYKYYYTRDEYLKEKGKEYVESKPKQNIVEIIEKSLEDRINKVIQETEENEFKRTGRALSDYDKEMIKLSLLQDMFDAIGKYVEKTDELKNFVVDYSHKGNFTIKMNIVRDGEPRYLETEAIYAGGYNIQRLHFRYITNTDLAQKDTFLTNKYKERATKLTKLERLNEQKDYTEKAIERYEKEIAEREVMTDEEKALAGGGYDIMKNTKWEDLVKRGADKNFDYSEEVFNNQRDKQREDNIKSFNTYTGYLKSYLKAENKDLEKKNKKIEEFTQNELSDNIEKSEKIEGGLADNKTLEDIATHHKCSLKEIEDEVEIGKKVEMEHTDDLDEALEITKDHLWEIPDYYTRLAKMEKEAKKEDNIEKSKAAQIGEIRTWSGIKMKKTSDGWVPVKEKKDKIKTDEDSSNKENSNQEPEKKEYSEKELAEFAKQTSESDLKQAASGSDEKLRIAAKKELERRNIEETPKTEENSKESNVDDKVKDRDLNKYKKKQLDIILKNNPSPDEIHTWIRSEYDIKTAEEAFNESIETDESTPDFKKENMENALKEGFVTIYSSYPIRDGAFVTPSKMEAQSYAGKKDVFSKKVNLDDVAWIDGLQGQFAPINNIEESVRIEEDSKKKDEKISTDLTKKILEDKVKSLSERFIKSKNTNESLQIARYLRRIEDFKNYDVEKQINNFSQDLSITEKEIKGLFGDGEILGFVYRGSKDFEKGKGSADINILTKDMCCSRLLNFDEKKVTNEEFLLDVDLEKGKGIGSDIFINQVEQFKKLGFKTMETMACRKDESQNGYYTWARLGYDISQPSKSHEEFLNTVKDSDNKQIKDSKSLHELMSFKEGRDFWKKYGFTFLGIFDLNDKSDSIKILKAYQQSKK